MRQCAMKGFRFLLVVGCVLFSTSAVYAVAEPPPTGMDTVALATITNDRDNSISTIYALLNDQNVFRGIYLKTIVPRGKQPSRVQGRVYWLSAIESGDGVVLGQGQGVDAIYLRGDVNSQQGRGTLVIEYLSNGIFWSYDDCRVGLRRVAPQEWRLVSAYSGEPIEHIKVQTWALGISTLTNVCPAA